MFKRILVESYRNKRNRPLSFFVNWLGLTLGFAAVIVMYLYIIGEVRHDAKVYTKSMDDVYRCKVEHTMGAICPAPLSDFMVTMPEVAASARITIQPQQTVSSVDLPANNKFKADIMLADSSLLRILPFKLIAGSASDALAGQSNVIVSRDLAMRLYGTTDVAGRVVEFNNLIPMQITAVMEDLPENSTWETDMIGNIRFQALMFSDGKSSDATNMFSEWHNWAYETYVLLNPGVNPVDFEAKYSKALVDVLNKEWGRAFKDTPTLQTFNDIYLSADEYTMAKTTDSNSLRILGLIAGLILVIAIINYVNIYTARSTEVVRSMGIKSVIGAERKSLVGFVVFDSVLLTLVSAISGFLLAMLLQPLYPSIIGTVINFAMSWDTLLILFVAMPLVCGVISGIFPALALTRMRPLEAIATRNGGGVKMTAVRNVLIVFQFAVTIILIALTLYINKQMTYMNELDLGYNRENVYIVSGDKFMGPRYKAFRSNLMANPKIKNVSYMQNNPMNIGNMMTLSWGTTKEENKTVMVQWADENSLATLGVSLVEGDSISPTNIDSLRYQQMMINETFANILREQIPDITFPYKDFIGVFKDFQHASLKSPITPLAIGSIWNEGSAPYGNVYVRMEGGDLPATLKFIENTFHELYPDELYEGSFMDEAFNNMYNEEQLFRARLLTFSILAIFIGCLGLFALVGYSVERRRKEIGIRKVYGSNIIQLIMLLCSGFMKWLVLAFILSLFPVWYCMNAWVEQFAYRTPISWWIFALSGLTAFFIAIVTIVGQTYHAATENPVKSIKSE